jgi:hypothetical protein
MAIDYLVDYKCFPKQELTAEGILERIKGRARAEAVIQLFRDNGDERPAAEIGFEMARNTPDGTEETRVLMVQDLLDQAEQLGPYEHYCVGCPASATGKAFGCMGQIDYPISHQAEVWLLKQMPLTDETLVWLMLKQAVEEMHMDGSMVTQMREVGQPFFEDKSVMARGLGELTVNTNQLFQMTFLAGSITPAYASVLLLLYKAIARNLDADTLMSLATSPEDAQERYPFLHQADPEDDNSVRQFKQFLQALYLAWVLNVKLTLDV